MSPIPAALLSFGLSAFAGSPDLVEVLQKTSGYATEAQINEMSAEDREEFISLLSDRAWPSRHGHYLRHSHDTEPEQFPSLPQERQGSILLQWLRQKKLALDRVRQISESGHLAELSELKNFILRWRDSTILNWPKDF